MFGIDDILAFAIGFAVMYKLSNNSDAEEDSE